MFDRRFIAELVAIIAASVLCAMIANAIAGRERKLALAGQYPNALRVTQRTQTPALPGPAVETPLIAPATDTMAEPLVSANETAAPTPLPATQTIAPATRPAPVQPAPARLGKFFPPHPDRPWVEIHYEDARVLYDRKAMFIDARRTSIFEQGHIVGARSISVWESDVDDKVAAMAMAGLDGNAPIVIYCSGGNCEDSHMLAERLFGVGFNNVMVYKDGYPDWQQQGGPVETGAAR